MAEMTIASDQNQAMLQGERRNPNIIFRDGFSLCPQASFCFPILLCGDLVTGQHDTLSYKPVNMRQVDIPLPRFMSPIIKFTKHNAGNENLRFRCQMLLDASISGKQG